MIIKRMIRIVLLSALFCSALLWGENVQIDEDELANLGGKTVNFTSYVGPADFVNTLDQIRNIGRGLGQRINPALSGEAATGNKYRVLHIVTSDIPEGLDADIFILDEDAAVDHIVNLRYILAGYLESAYGLTGRDAYLIAEFATYYNAVYRADLEMVENRYKAPVADALSPEKIGIDTHYSNWPGLTQMLIPLRGDQVKVDTGAISGPEVTEELRREEDKGIGIREDMVELREKELDEEQANLNERREETERKQQDIARELEELDNKEEEGSISPAERERKQELEEEEHTLNEEKKAIEKDQKKIDERTEDVMQMRDDLAEDRNAALKEQEAQKAASPTAAEEEAPVTPTWFLTVDDEGKGIPFGRVIKYNLNNGETLAESPITAVRGRRLVLQPDTVLIIAGKTGGNSKVHPMLLDRNTLEIRKEGTSDIFPGSLIQVKDNDIFLVSMEKGKWRLGKFNFNLEQTALSEVVVNPWTTISFAEDSLLVQGEKGQLLKLAVSTLQEIQK
ncbi:MAG: hypothetical protein B0D92_03850 [Spirochaeta sp. LUC14_002_19_P3]|nr:MAG: hypothetical protein B0D92_03850 [Spirochaeta sp. LUC14_002_19_P3]